MIDSLIAALAAAAHPARHRGRATAATRLHVFGGVWWMVSPDVRLGAVGAFVFRSCRLVGGRLGVGRVARSLVLVGSALLRAGWAGGSAVAVQCIVFLLLSSWMCAAAGGVGHVC